MAVLVAEGYAKALASRERLCLDGREDLPRLRVIDFCRLAV